MNNSCHVKFLIFTLSIKECIVVNLIVIIVLWIISCIEQHFANYIYRTLNYVKLSSIGTRRAIDVINVALVLH